VFEPISCDCNPHTALRLTGSTSMVPSPTAIPDLAGL
jgi:hypothetical protein